jgi:hypothetical protein
MWFLKFQKKKKTFSEGEIIKESLEAVAGVALPDQKHIISKISLSKIIVGRGIEELTKDKSTDASDRETCHFPSSN